MLSPDVLQFARGALPPAPARVLEVGAGGGELAAALRAGGHEVVAIDPASETDDVGAVALLDLDAPARASTPRWRSSRSTMSEPLRESVARLAELVRTGGTLVVDEMDVERFDERAAAWWLEHHEDDHPPEHAEVVENLREHIHPVALVRAELEPSVRARRHRPRAVPAPLGPARRACSAKRSVRSPLEQSPPPARASWARDAARAAQHSTMA